MQGGSDLNKPLPQKALQVEGLFSIAVIVPMDMQLLSHVLLTMSALRRKPARWV